MISLIEVRGGGRNQLFQQVLVVLCIFTGVSVYGQDCIYGGDCDCDGTAIVCEALSLTRIPPMNPVVGNYITLNLAINYITNVPVGSLAPNLVGLYMQRNPISFVADAAFDSSASTLKTLYFSEAMFTRIPDAFAHLKSLNLLNLQDLNVTDWNDAAMKNIGQTLTALFLDNVGFTSWPSWMQYFPHLSTLTISTSSISSLPDDAFDSFVNNLLFLTMTSNELTQVPQAFSKLTSLQQLDLQQNKIVDVAWLPPASRLTVLCLQNNLVWDSHQLSDAIRPYSDFLGEFHVTFNRLTSVPNVTFLTQINNFDFSNNKMSDATSGAIAAAVGSIDFTNNFLPAIPRVLTTSTSVSDLTLNYNSIRQIQASDFPASATVVELGQNLITELTDNSFPTNSQITDLHLNNNPIVTISNAAFRNLAQLKDLNLQGTRLSRLPLAMGSLSSLYMLDMRDNPNLVCTCQEKSLQHVILNMPAIYVQGSCGLMGIQQFFSTLSPSCPY